MLHSVPAHANGVIGVPHPASVRVLLLDDSNFDRARIRRISRKTDLVIDMDEVDSIEEMDRAVKANSYDLILVDYRLPVGDGLVALNHLLEDPRNRDAGKIMITGEAVLGTAVEAMRIGFHDFLTKDDINPQMLNQAMVNAIALARQRQQMQLQTAHQHDIIRQGLIAALNDVDVQGNVVSMVRAQLANAAPDPTAMLRLPQEGSDETAVHDLLRNLADEDDFIFH